MALLEFENFDFLSTVKPNLVPKIGWSSVLVNMKFESENEIWWF